MTKEEKRIYDDIMTYIRYKDADFSLSALPHGEAYRTVANMLTYLTESVGCHGYLFILSVTKLEERYAGDLTPYLWEILDQYVTYPNLCFRKDVAFAAFYNIGLHFARRFQSTNLKELLSAPQYIAQFFEEYPLYLEMAARYLGGAGKHDRQVLLAKSAQRRFSELSALPSEKRTCRKSGYVETGNNVGVKISLVSAVCAYAEFLYVRSGLEGDKLHNLAPENEALNERVFREFLDCNPYESDYYTLTEEDLITAENLVDQAISYNPSYPKYPYLKARVLFYRHILKDLPLSAETRAEIGALLETAKRLENTKAEDFDLRVAQYDLFFELVDNHCRGITGNKELERQKRDILCKEECPPHYARPKANFNEDGEFVFVSYCSLDFKSVYVDLLEMKKRGIRFWYDRETVPGEKWYHVIPEYLQKATCVVCYLSDDYMTRDAVQKELELVLKYQKPVICVDMTGKRRISKSIISAIRNRSVNQISSQMMKTLIEVFDDDLDTIARSKDATVTSHVNRLYDVLMKRFPGTISLGRGEAKTQINNRYAALFDYARPNEDALFYDERSKVYAVADGISRKKGEYAAHPGESIARTVAETFVSSIGKNLSAALDLCPNFSRAKLILKEQFQKANAEIAALLKEKISEYDPAAEIPGCVCLVGTIYQDKFIFGTAGDCMGILVRDGQTMVFSQKQTSFAFEKLKIESDRDLLYREYVNKSDNEFGYGVVNGDENAVNCFKISHVELKAGDVIYLATDGVSDFVQYAKGDRLNKMSLDEIFAASDEQDRLANVKYSDDKTLVRIFVGE